MKTQINVAVLGCGQMGNTIITTLESMPEVARIVGYDVSEGQLAKTKEKHPRVETTTNYDDIIDDK